MGYAQEISLIANDTNGQSSFSTSGNWSNGATPSPVADYLVSGTYLRTPENGVTRHVFAGRSLTVEHGGAVLLKSTGDAMVEVANLTLSNGYISHFGLGDSILSLEGNLAVDRAGGYLYGGNGSLWLAGSVHLGGQATVWGSLNPANGVQTFGEVDFSSTAELVLSATTNVNNTISDVNFTQAFSSLYTFRLTDDRVAPWIAGEGAAERIDVTFGGTFRFDLEEALLAEGRQWQIVDTGSIGGVLSYTSTFSIDGFTSGSGGMWYSTDGRLGYNEVNGLLTVVAVPEPGTWFLLAGGTIVLLARWRRH